MPKMSVRTRRRIIEQIISFLYENYPSSYTPKRIGYELARDNEFVTGLLKDLEKKKVIGVNREKSKYFTYYRLSKVAKQAYDNK